MSRRPPEDRWAGISFHKQGLATAAFVAQLASTEDLSLAVYRNTMTMAG
jgi:hypothetical protein